MRYQKVVSIFLIIFSIFIISAPLLYPSERIKIIRYQIEATFDLSQQKILAKAEITIPAEVIGVVDTVYLLANSAGTDTSGNPLMKIQRIRSKSGRILHYRVDDDKMISISLNERMTAGTSATIQVEYVIPYGEEDAGWKKYYGYFLFPGLGEDSHWYPVLPDTEKNASRFYDFEVELTYPKELALLTSGSISAKGKSKGNQIQQTFVAEHIEGFSLCFSEDFVIGEAVQNGIKVMHFSSKDLVDRFHLAAEVTADAIDWYKKTYGFFPVQQIGIIAGHPRWSGGYPLPNVFMIHRGNLEPEFIRWITAHELGHYYWGLYVLSATPRNLDWLMLANGIWIDQLYMAQVRERTNEEQWRSLGSGNWYVDYITAQFGNYEQRLGLPEKDVQTDVVKFDYNSYIRHGKAAVGLYLQSRLLGFDRFLEFQKNLLKDFQYKPLSALEFAQRLEDAGLEGASRFFKQWERGDASINYDILDIETEVKSDSHHYQVRVRNTGTVNYPVILAVTDEAGETARHEISGEQRDEVVNGAMKHPIVDVSLDPDGILPMWNSAHPEMQRNFIIGLHNSGKTHAFRVMAEDYLSRFPNDEAVRSRLDKQLQHDLRRVP